MKMRLSCTRLSALALFLCTLAIVGCGGSSGDGDKNDGDSSAPSYSGSTSAATASTENQEDIAATAREGALQVISQDGTDIDLPFGVAINDDVAQQIADLSFNLILDAQLPTGVVSTIQGDCGGTARVSPIGASTTNFRVDFNNYCIRDEDGNVRINGHVDYTVTESTTIIAYRNVRITGNGINETLNATITCSNSELSGGCFYTSDFTGSDGQTYRIADANITGDEYEGYDVSARVYHPALGYVDIQATSLVLCDNGNIGSGSIAVTDSTGTEVLTVSFTSCDEMAVTFNGVSATYPQ